MPVTINGTTGITTPALVNGTALAFRNKIINGAMTIAQRTNGSVISVSNTRTSGFALDRWSVWLANWTGGTATQQQSTDVPSGQGFVNSLLVTVTTASSTPDPTTGRFLINQMIEGFNVADLNWGTASAKSITVSFWVKSSVTGNYGLTLTNHTGSRGYVVSYAINTTNTWEQKIVTIPGDTSGTWSTDNNSGVILNYDLGVNGSTTDTVNTWLTGDYRGLTSGVNLINTNGATFYITGVQLEAGSVATPFENRPIGTELALCQRYYELCVSITTGSTGSGWYSSIPYKTSKRGTPTLTILSNSIGTLDSTPILNSNFASAAHTLSSNIGLSTVSISAEL